VADRGVQDVAVDGAARAVVAAAGADTGEQLSSAPR
jgi:hypothetical protein